ncbi:MAG: UDP-2,3-diacylglucosamine diphosphatase [Betaproteobacteria bacterium]|nr:UDP-2,3-diacylglucosamine diphosphatase [Betaproteobacteria bacterium]
MLYFISDLHLADDTPGIFALFRALLDRIADEGNSLYILGDLFAVWIGDDDDAPFAQDVACLLRDAAEQGLRIFFQRGNRDFLVGNAFASAAQLELLPDPYCLKAPGTPEKSFLLTHGDILCTEDGDYQAFRRQVRDSAWQQNFLQKPLGERRKLAAALQAESVREKGRKADYQMDVSNCAVEDLMRAYGQSTLLHGHIHRPGRHQHLLDGLSLERWVLADWSESQGEYLFWDCKTLTRQAFFLP